MLREILYVKQERKKDRKRWFTDEDWDVYVWVRGDGSFSGFQLCYDKSERQRALTWMDGSEPTHAAVDEDESGLAGEMRAPLLVADGTFDVRGVARRFWQVSSEIDQQVRNHIIIKLKELMRVKATSGNPGTGRQTSGN